MFHPYFIEYEPRHRRLLDQYLGLGLTPKDQLKIIAIPNSPLDYYMPWKNLLTAAQASSTIKEDKDKFQVNLDVQHFAPEEISVKTVDGYLVVEAKHEEKQDEHGFISRSFTRKYALPEGIESDSVVSKLSSDGVLTITAPLEPQPKASNERMVPIVHTGPVRKQDNKEEQG